ncbi:Golgin-84 [Cocos nucifera]|uniref:Golgin-84 n=1 Tax=Cocos nucifera TaxID=13894 RepID=A0A8K0IUB6_COCNU|nr:Golgin-84 [Cocos nucifera]
MSRLPPKPQVQILAIIYCNSTKLVITCASNVQEVQARKAKAKKGQVKLSSTETYEGIRPEQDQKSKQPSVQNEKTDNVRSSPSEHSLDVSVNDTAGTSTEPPSDNYKDTVISDSENVKGRNGVNNVMETMTSFTNDDINIANSKDELERPSSPPSIGKGIGIANGVHPADAEPEVNLVDETASLTIDKKIPESEAVESHSTSNTQENEKEVFLEPSPNLNKQQQHKTNGSPMKVQDQLDEAQGLLKSAVKTGQSKEARLARVCAGLSSRLQEYKTENAQLEELLVAEKELSSSCEARIKQLEQDFSASKMEVARVESDMADALSAKNSEIEALTVSIGDLKKQSAAAEEKLASLQADMETVMRSRKLTETRMIQALREELASAERRAEEERAAHSATKMAAVEREVELDHRAVESSNALARIQRQADESTTRATELEHKVALLEVECASLTQELQDIEARNRHSEKKPSEETSQNLQIQAWQEEVERARQGQREADNKLSSLEAEIQKMRVEMAAMRRDAEHYSRQEHMELEKHYHELTDFLYHKQTQLEAMASEKAAMEFQLEKELKRFQEVPFEAERSRATRRSSLTWEEDTNIKALEPLPLHHRHMFGASIQLQKAAKLLDSGAVRATRFLWRHPIARVILLFYLVFVHLFLMYVLHRLQEQADNFASREVALSMGLGNSSLP